MPVIDSSQRVGNLPVELTSFVGRRHELAEVKQALSGRLVTLTGTGGVGKTRVALRAAAELSRGFEDGAWLVELADVRDPDLLLQTVAGVFDVREQIGRPLVASLTDFLGTRRALLVLDNCEHLRDGCARLCRTLLDACPQVRLLATSRQPLDVVGEAVLAIAPLQVPERSGTSAGPVGSVDAATDPAASLESLARSDAVCLFLDRAAGAVPGFRLTTDNAAAVAGICRRVDGLPLAIELAAVRLRALSAEQILDRLADRYRLLTRGMREAPARQQTLRACLEWSHDLCDDAEQRLWARLGVFSGGFYADAVAGICVGDGVPPDQVDDLLSTLADRSVLVREEHPEGPRYRLLETIRQFALDSLHGQGEYQRWARRHRDWYLHLVQSADEEWIGPRQEYWLTRMEREHPNVRSALEFSLAGDGGTPGSDDVAAAAGLLVVPWRIYWWALGLISEGRRWAERLIGTPGGPLALRARVHTLASHLAVYQADYASGRVRLEQARELATRSGDPIARSYAAFAAGMYGTYTGDLPGAIAAFEEGLRICDPLPDVAWRLDLLMPLAVDLDLIGQRERAIACHEESLALTEPRGEGFHRSYALWALGLALWQRGELSRAVGLEQQSLRLKRSLHDWLGVVFCLEALASISAGEQRHERATVLLGAADVMWRAMGSSPSAAGHLAGFHEDCVRECGQELGPAGYRQAFDRGRAMTTDRALGYALGEDPGGATDPGMESSWARLTRRQRQVAELIGRGLSNRDIAETLVISQRTAEGHVDRLLDRLGFTSRAQVAAWWADRGPEPRR